MKSSRTFFTQPLCELRPYLAGWRLACHFLFWPWLFFIASTVPPPLLLRPQWTTTGGLHDGWMGGLHSAASAVKYVVGTVGMADYVVSMVMKSIFVIEDWGRSGAMVWWEFAVCSKLFWWNGIFDLEHDLCCCHQYNNQSMNNTQNVLFEKLYSLKTALCIVHCAFQGVSNAQFAMNTWKNHS